MVVPRPYPIIANVAGVAAGVYHYNARDHSLELLVELPDGQSGALATKFMCGQTYFGSAHVSIIITARFSRNHWKYRRHQKAYASILVDAAHLSQTLYLVSGDLGLGAFVTAAINSREIGEYLGRDGIDEGAVLMVGFGKRARERSALEPKFSRYVPGETRI